MSWNKIASDLLITNSPFDNWKLFIPDNVSYISLPKIIKLSLKLLEKSFTSGKKKIIIVYPEGIYLPSLTVVFQAFSDIISGKTNADNDFRTYKPGQKLIIDNLVCQFVGFAEKFYNNNDYICVKFADLQTNFPVDRAPLFQKTDTKRPLSKYKGKLMKKDDSLSVFDVFISSKTFLTNTIQYVTSSNRFSESIGKIVFDTHKISDLLLLGRVKNDSTLEIINKGQFDGIPAILFSNDLYSLNTQNLENTKYLFIEYSDNIVNNQLDVFDNLIKKDFPIIILSDSINSFNLENLENRGFITLRWDKDSLAPILDDTFTDGINQKIINCCNKHIDYIPCENTEISKVWNLMKSIRYDMTNNTNQTIIDLFWRLYDIILSLLHKTINMPLQYKKLLLSNIDEINNKIKEQSYYISPENISRIYDISNDLKIILDDRYQFRKIIETENIIISSTNNSIIIIPDNEDKSSYISYWNNIFDKKDKNIIVMYAQEYTNQVQYLKADVIVCGWLGRNKMRNILFCNNESRIYILLNKIENQWRKSHTSEWDKICMADSRREFDKYFTSIELKPVSDSFEKHEENIDDIDEINITIQKNRYIRYCTQNTTGDSIEAIPITFVSGYFSFYKKSSDIITVTEIINSTSEDSKAIIKLSIDLQVGDFVVIRETQRSLIRELADKILNKEGKNDYREISRRWKNKLLERCRVSTITELHERVKKEGSTIGLAAFRSWINNDDFIAPQDKDNLLYIAAALNDTYLINNIEKIFDVCRYVRASHVKAGNEISNKLKKGIADSLSGQSGIKRKDIWDPIDLNLDELGKVKILKITNIGDPISVDIIHTNRLLTESPREKYQIEGRSTKEVFMEYELGQGDCKARGFIPDESKIYRRFR